MTDALRRGRPVCFREPEPARVEAACLPPQRSVPPACLLQVGFSEEGYARQYLKINGRWQDHLLFALLDNDPPGREGIAGQL